jgi:hypothetical protein
MLEMGETLKTWALAELPQPGVEVACQALPDHRLAWLDYEGAVSGDRGWVVRWDRGTYRLERQTEVELVVILAGQWIVGQASLCQVPQQPGQWRFTLTMGVA